MGRAAALPLNLLFITATRIGDAVLSTGLLGDVLDRHPGARVTLACGPAARGLFLALPGLERLIVLEKRRFLGHWLALWRAVVASRWDLAIDLRKIAFGRPFLERCLHRLPHVGRKHGFQHRVAQPFRKGDRIGKDPAAVRGGQHHRAVGAADGLHQLFAVGRASGRTHVLQHVNSGIEGVAHRRLVIDMGVHLDAVPARGLDDGDIILARQPGMGLDHVDAHFGQFVDHRRTFLRRGDHGRGFGREATKGAAGNQRARYDQARAGHLPLVDAVAHSDAVFGRAAQIDGTGDPRHQQLPG